MPITMRMRKATAPRKRAREAARTTQKVIMAYCSLVPSAGTAKGRTAMTRAETIEIALIST